MGMLHLVPYFLLMLVASWLFWPVVVDPFRRRLSRFHPEVPAPDGVADALFVAWSHHAEQARDSKKPA